MKKAQFGEYSIGWANGNLKMRVKPRIVKAPRRECRKNIVIQGGSNMKQKLIALLMVLCLSLSLLAGCGDGGKTTTEAPTEADKSTQGGETQGSESTEAEPAEPDKLTIWVEENLRVEDWVTNAQTLWLEEKGNFDLEIIAMPSADYKTKVGVALTVGNVEDLPDIILGSFKIEDIAEYAEAETIVPLTDYYNDPEKSPNITQLKETVGFDYTNTMYLPDGNIYSVGSFSQAYGNEYPHKIFIYKPWLDALGEEIPTTTEDFYRVLKKVKETDLNGNGKHDEIPYFGAAKTYVGWFKALMNSFEYAAGIKVTNITDDGKVYAAFATEEWKKGLAYMEKLFDEDLIISEALTMDATQANALLNNEEHLVFSMVYYNASGVDTDDYIAILPMEGPDGVQYSSYGEASASHRFVVTANCKNVDAAFRLGDLMSSEYFGIQSRFGKEGVDWVYAKDTDTTGLDVAIEGWEPSIVLLDNDSNWKAELQNNCWRGTGISVLTYWVTNGRMHDPATVTKASLETYRAQKLYQDTALHPKYDPSKLVFTDEEMETLADIETALTNYYEEFYANVFAGNIDLDKEWDNYLAELDKIGLDEWVAVYQAAFDRAYKK